MAGRDLEPLATDDDGNILVAFHPAGDHIGVRDAPLTVSLVALWHDGCLLLVFNRQRACWELPGGMIDPGETPRQGAIRELHEESGHQLDDLTFAGYARFALGPERRAEHAAIYAARATPGNAFAPNDEITAITWWDGTSPLAGQVQPLDVCLGRLARAALRQQPGRRPINQARPDQGPPACPVSLPRMLPVPQRRSSVTGGGVASAALHGFVLSASLELRRGLRINAVSPGLAEDAVDTFGDRFPGLSPVPMVRLTGAYLESVEGDQSGQILRAYT